MVNPGDGAVGSVMPNALGVAVGYGTVPNYALVASLYATLARTLPENADRYLRAAAATADKASDRRAAQPRKKSRKK